MVSSLTLVLVMSYWILYKKRKGQKNLSPLHSHYQHKWLAYLWGPFSTKTDLCSGSRRKEPVAAGGGGWGMAVQSAQSSDEPSFCLSNPQMPGCCCVFSLNTTGSFPKHKGTSWAPESRGKLASWPLSVGAEGLMGQHWELTTMEAVWSLKA